MNDRQQKTYDAIVARCASLTPAVDIAKHIKQGTLRVANWTLDGIKFEAVNPADLEAELGGRMPIPGRTSSPQSGSGALSFQKLREARPANASMISMKEDPTHWALKASFAATVGTGFREQWRPPPETEPMLAPTPSGSRRITLGFGETGQSLRFTALHAAVAASECGVHIDERGFVVATPEGAAVTPSFYSHLANELLLKSIFRDWLDGIVGDYVLGKVVVEAVNRLSLRFPDAENGFAGLSGRVNRIRGVRDVGNLGKTLLPIGVSADLSYRGDSSLHANYFWHDGQHTVTVSLGGTF